MQVSRWGNSLAVRLPKTLVDAMSLKEGDQIDVVEVIDRTLVVEKDRRRQLAIENMRRRALAHPVGYKFDREEANER